MLHYFDAHIRTDCIEGEVLENLAYFNVKHVLLAAHAPTPFKTAEELLAYLGGLVTDEFCRIERAGLTPVVALGVHPDAVPKRAHYEVWRDLPVLLDDPNVVAVGELALEEESKDQLALLERQLALAHEKDMPVLTTANTRERARKVRQILDIIDHVGICTSRVLVNHVDFTCLKPVIDAGCWAGVTVGPMHLGLRDALEMLRRFRGSAVDKVILNSGLRTGPVDVLALPKLALMLTESGFSQSEVRRLVWGNAMRLFLEKRER